MQVASYFASIAYRPSMLCLNWYLYIDTYLPKVDVVCRSCPCKCKSKVKSGQFKQGQPGDVKLVRPAVFGLTAASPCIIFFF